MKKLTLVFLVFVVSGIIISQVVFGETFNNSNSKDAPVLIEKSYIEESLIPQLEEDFKEILKKEVKNVLEGKDFFSDDMKEKEEVLKGPGAFKVEELEGGEKLIAGDSTEIIPRTGEGTIIEGPGGGVSDLTGAKDLSKGDEVPMNHHLLIPRDDGRGIDADSYMILMIRGDYSIEKD